MQLLIAIIGILVTILFVIGTHEFAHFIAARMLGVKVLRFSIGFGKRLFSWSDKKGTEFVFSLIPLGGYVKMLDENEGQVSSKDLPHAFNRQPFYKKFLIVLAGPFANILCAFILYWLIFMIGIVTVKPIIGQVTPKSIAAEAGLKPHQEIISIDDKPLFTWPSIIFRILFHAGNQDQLKMEVRELSKKNIELHILDLSDWHMDELAPDPLASLGIVPYEPILPLIIGIIHAHSPAADSPLRVGDTILSIDKKPIRHWNEVMTQIISHPGKTLVFTIKRENKKFEIPVTLGYQRDLFFQKTGYLGIGPTFTWPKELTQQIKFGPLKAIPQAWQTMLDFTYFNFLLFGKLITGKISLQSLGGPITIFESAGAALNYGFLAFISFLAFLSISIGIINILPIPGLDGGHLFIFIIEFIIQRPLPQKLLFFLYQMGFVLIIYLLFQALINDILRL